MTLKTKEGRANTNWKGVKPNPHEYFGFIYIIHNKVDDKLYLGRKQYHRYVKKKKGNESDWRKYKGSSKNVHADMVKHGLDNFDFYIIGNAKTRGGLVYSEANLQHKYDVLTQIDSKGERRWSNGQIGSTKFIPKETVKVRLPKKIKELMK